MEQYEIAYNCDNNQSIRGQALDRPLVVKELPKVVRK